MAYKKDGHLTVLLYSRYLNSALKKSLRNSM